MLNEPAKEQSEEGLETLPPASALTNSDVTLGHSGAIPGNYMAGTPARANTTIQ